MSKFAPQLAAPVWLSVTLWQLELLDFGWLYGSEKGFVSYPSCFTIQWIVPISTLQNKIECLRTSRRLQHPDIWALLIVFLSPAKTISHGDIQMIPSIDPAMVLNE